jgi:hypothetical protein
MNSRGLEQPSGFLEILARLGRDVPGAAAAIFCDAEGESIEFWGTLDPYDIKLTGAYASILLSLFEGTAGGAGSPPEVTVTCRELTLIVRGIERYRLVLLLRGRSWSPGLDDALDAAAARFAVEAGLAVG